MWVITGPFDGKEAGEIGFDKRKLLKTGRSYVLGRKARDLVVNHKKISHDCAEFIVGRYSQDDVADPSVIPTLELHNTKSKAMSVKRALSDTSTSQEPLAMIVNPSATHELRDGDVVMAVMEVALTVRWVRVCCYAQSTRGKSSVPLDSCASLGINVVTTPHADITHHLTPNYTLSTPIGISLLSAAQFVKPDWLTETIRLGNLLMHDDPANGLSLEEVFALPLEIKFKPAFASSLPSTLKVFKVWEPDEQRLNMLRGYRFVFVGEKGREASSEMRELIARGQGQWEAFNVAAGKLKWHQLLAKGKKRVTTTDGGKELVLVADENAMAAAVGKDGWKELVDEAKSFGLRFVTPENVLEAVAYVRTSYVDSSAGVDEEEGGGRSSSPLPDFVPNTHPDEPSIPPGSALDDDIPAPSKKLVRRAASSNAPSRPSTPPLLPPTREDGEPMPPPRRPLKRRAKTGKLDIIGLDDPSSTLDGEPDVSTSARPSAEPELLSVPLDLKAPTPARSSRLKRRAGTAALSVTESQFPLQDDEAEPPLKKFKALFEASDPDRIAQGMSHGSDLTQEELQSQSLTQNETQAQSRARSGLRGVANVLALGVVAEEEEESSIGTAAEAGRGRKRKAADTQDEEDGDIDMANVEDTLQPTPSSPIAKKRAVENVNAVDSSAASKPPSTAVKPPSKSIALKSHKSDAAPGNPDKDAAFLKALASTKKGKKQEDAFDREFNKLRISKPDLQRDEQEKEWAVLEDFGDERNIRGNFMVVMEMEVFRKDESERARNERLEWLGRPNFKKFKKKTVPGVRTAIELVVNEEADYGMGSTYWKGNSQSQSQGDFATGTTQKQTQSKPKPKSETQTQTQTQTSRKGKNRAFVVDDSDDDVVEPPVAAAPTRTATRASTQKRTQHIQNREKSQPLFLSDSDEIKDDPHANDDDDFLLGPEEQDEDVLTLQSSNDHEARTRRSARAPAATQKKNSKSKAAVIVDDDSDDGATFRGFRGKRKR